MVFNEEGKFIVLHHHGAGKYYKMNFLFLMAFFGFSYINYKNNPAIFLNERLGQIYLTIIGLGIIGLLVFGNRHIKTLYLLKNGREVVIETY